MFPLRIVYKLIREANEYKLVGFNEYFLIHIFCINTAKRLCCTVIRAFHVNSFAVGFALDVVAGFDSGKLSGCSHDEVS